MRKPSKEVLKELKESPYKFYEGVDYRKIMSLTIPAIKIDTRDEQRHLSDQIIPRKNSVNSKDGADH